MVGSNFLVGPSIALLNDLNHQKYYLDLVVLFMVKKVLLMEKYIVLKSLTRTEKFDGEN